MSLSHRGDVPHHSPLRLAAVKRRPPRWGAWGFWDGPGRGHVQICCKGVPGRDRPREEARNINVSLPVLRRDRGLCNRFGQTSPPRAPGGDSGGGTADERCAPAGPWRGCGPPDGGHGGRPDDRTGSASIPPGDLTGHIAGLPSAFFAGPVPRVGRGRGTRSTARHLFERGSGQWPFSPDKSRDWPDGAGGPGPPRPRPNRLTNQLEIGRASCRERV